MSNDLLSTIVRSQPVRTESQAYVTAAGEVRGMGNPEPRDGKVLPQQAATPAVSEADLNRMVSHLNDFAQALHRDLHFSVDEDSGRTIVKVVDSETKEVIRQFPPEEILVLARHMRKGEGLILSTQA
jgi:flagellar protein FlaG